MAMKMNRYVMANVAQHSFVIFSVNNYAWFTVTLRNKNGFSLILLLEISNGYVAVLTLRNNPHTRIVNVYLAIMDRLSRV